MCKFEKKITDSRVYRAKFVRCPMDPETPTFNQAMSSPDNDKYIDATKEKIA